MIGFYHERLDQTRYLGAVMLAKAFWIFDDDSKIWDDHLRLLRHNCTDTVCSGVYGNREFPRRDSLSSHVSVLTSVGTGELPRRNCCRVGGN
ncbi:hypothetical protein YC2023_100020 [Brassica napus]